MPSCGHALALQQRPISDNRDIAVTASQVHAFILRSEAARVALQLHQEKPAKTWTSDSSGTVPAKHFTYVGALGSDLLPLPAPGNACSAQGLTARNRPPDYFGAVFSDDRVP